jgi:hypothetical protein
MTEPDGRTPDAPDVDQPEGGAHTGETAEQAEGTTPSAPDVDQPEGGSHDG